MDISGQQLRRFKNLLSDDQQPEFEKIFSRAFAKEEITREVKIEITWYYSWAQLTLVHNGKTIAKIHLSSSHQEKRFYEKHPCYEIEAHRCDGTFKVYKLID